MQNLVGNTTGLVHLIASVFAILFGSIILIMKKGTKRHIQLGYVYTTSMVILLVSSFMLYRLFGRFGLFHVASIISSLTLFFGMIPAIRRKPKGYWLIQHLSFMYWSVIGLYAALASEALTRIPETPFFGMVGLATGIIILVGGIFFIRKREKWRKLFSTKKGGQTN